MLVPMAVDVAELAVAVATAALAARTAVAMAVVGWGVMAVTFMLVARLAACTAPRCRMLIVVAAADAAVRVLGCTSSSGAGTAGSMLAAAAAIACLAAAAGISLRMCIKQAVRGMAVAVGVPRTA